MKFSRLPVRLIITALLLAAGAAHAERIVILGDSLSDAYGMPREAGWVHRLDQRLGESHQLIDGAISGDTSAGAVSRINGLVEVHRPQVLIVILGGNDGLRGLPPAALERNLATLIERGKSVIVKIDVAL
ncbi:MAG: GDSL-type esterase/lipase family protein, partial [Wenzhouxiangellaceae bacterium]